ncbi:MAG: cytochrome D1 domain-containing protein, partial [Gammaproteobacteria bacterium]
MKLLVLSLLLAAPAAAGTLRIYVANSAGNNVTIIDPAAMKAVGEIIVSPSPHGIVPSPDKSRFYVSSEADHVLDIVDRKSGKVIRRVPIGRRPNNVAITADGRRVYICIREESWVDIVDTETMEKVKSVPVGRNPHNVYATANGKWMLATSMGDQKLTLINIKTEEPEFEIPVGGIPRPVAIEADGSGAPRRLFVQLSDLHGFAVVDFAARKVMDKILLPDAPAGATPLIPRTFSHGIGIAPDRKTLWVTSLLDNSVSVFSMPDLKRLDTIATGRAPDWLTFTPDS